MTLSRKATLILTRPNPPDASLIQSASYHGIHVVSLPLLHIEYCFTEEVVRYLSDVQSYDYVVITSATAVRALATVGERRNIDWRTMAPPFVAVGQATAQAARELGLRVVSPSVGGTSRDLVSWMTQQPEFQTCKNFLLPQGQLTGTTLHSGLQALGHKVTSFVCYETNDTPVQPSAWHRICADADVVIIAFYSPSAAASFSRQCEFLRQAYGDCLYFASIGPSTALAMDALQLPVWCTAASPSNASLLDAVITKLSNVQ